MEVQTLIYCFHLTTKHYWGGILSCGNLMFVGNWNPILNDANHMFCHLPFSSKLLETLQRNWCVMEITRLIK